MIQFSHNLRVRYGDTDQMGVVYNVKFLEYFEVGRTELLRSLGLPYKKLEESGVMLVVTESYIKHKNPAFYDDILTIVTTVKEKPKFILNINYEIFREGEDKSIIEGKTTHVFINAVTKKPVRLPSIFIETISPNFQ